MRRRRLRCLAIDGAEKVLSAPGPGPRNVLVRLPDGRLMVVPAGRWRWRRRRPEQPVPA